MYIFSIFIYELYFLIHLLDCLLVHWRIPLDDGVINDLRENPAHRYSFVCNAILNICNTQDTDRFTTLNSKVLKICIDFRFIVYQMNSCCLQCHYFHITMIKRYYCEILSSLLVLDCLDYPYPLIYMYIRTNAKQSNKPSYIARQQTSYRQKYSPINQQKL